jgi:tetratricopeptide (TPR) repeat protein
MKNNKKWMYVSFVALFAILVTGIVLFKGKKQEEVLPLKDRQGAQANSPEWKKTKETVAALMVKINNNPNDIESRVQLAQAYIQEGRVTGDHQYYDMAALRLLNGALKKNPNQFEALCFKSMVLLSQHHFAEGLDYAKKAVAQNDYNAFSRGLMIDGNVELGNYTEAVANTDKMVSIRPDLTSYSRVSYLREIYGDNEGAIEAMKMAVQAGFPGLEQTSWCRIQLGKLYENKGDLVNAKLQYDIALNQRPDYAYAYMGLARIEKYNKNYKEAIADVQKAKSLVTDNGFDDELSDLYTMNNQPDLAKKTAEELVTNLNQAADKGNSDDQIGHYADKELAYAYLKLGNTDKAMEHALIEYNRRPANNDVNEALAWVNYKKGNYKDADKYITVAMQTKSQNPTLLCRAGIIKTKNGDKQQGIALIKKAMQINPYLSPELTAEGTKDLAMN